MKLFQIILLVVFLSVANKSVAIPVHWLVEDIQFIALDGGGVAPVFGGGSFTFDADTGALSNVNIQTPTGVWFEQCSPPVCATAGLLVTDPFAGASYDAGNVLPQAFNFWQTADILAGGGLLDDPLLRLNLAAPLTNAGGVVSFAGIELLCPASCGAFDITQGTFRYVYSGTMRSAVPAPGTMAILLLGLVALASLKVQRTRT